MNGGVIRKTVSALVLAGSIPAAVSAQVPQGTISGRVVERATQQPIPSAQVVVVGTGRGAITNEEGRYQIQNVSAGQLQLRVLRIGYESVTQPVTVTAGQTATADFALATTAIKIDEVVVTATGETERRRETGNSIGTINVDSVELAATTTFSDVLSSRTAGVTVQQNTGSTGGSSRIRIRGSNSVSLVNDPLIIVDGVRLQSSGASLTPNIYVGGQEPSRFNDINPEDIENIEVLKGPSASALYGTAAANGVIQITTRRGRPGNVRWSAHAEGGTITEPTDYPANFARVGTSLLSGEEVTPCTLDLQASGLCAPVGNSILSFNPLEQASPFRDGWRQSYGLSVAGGGEAATYYLGGDFEREQGVYDINNLRRFNLRANLRGQIRDNLNVTVTSGYLQSNLRLPQNDNNILGILGGGLLGNAFDCSPASPCGDDTTSRGYILGQTPQELFAIETRQDVQRFTGGFNSNWRPLPWLTAVGTAGLDLLNRDDNETIPPNKVFFADYPLGYRTSDPFTFFTYTANGGLTAEFELTPRLRSSSSAGLQYVRERLRSTHAFGRNLLPGTSSLSGTNEGFEVAESTTVNTTIGGYLQQQLAWNDRVFLTGAVRGDDNSAFGTDFGVVYYPSFSASWVIGEEPFFPQTTWISSLRLRTAYGESGQRPSFRDALTYFSPVAVSQAGAEVPAITIGGVGLADLKPEKSKEYEVGLDASFFENRLGAEFTYYNKTTTDALIARRLASSAGGSQTRFENLGEVKNSGTELLLNATPMDSRPVKVDMTLNHSTNRNRLIELGEGITPIIFGSNSNQRHQEGYPLGAYFARRIVSFADHNGDGIISRANCPGQPEVPGGPACEIALSDSAEYLGTPFPRRELSLNTSVTLFQIVKLSALVDRRSGHRLLNYTERFRCSGGFSLCEAANNPEASLEDQAAAIGVLMGTDAGFVEDASFTKLRELSVTLMAPQSLAGRFGLDALSLTLAGRNLKTWTDYSGFDPEVNENAGLNFSTDEFLTQPPVRYFTARLNVSW